MACHAFTDAGFRREIGGNHALRHALHHFGALLPQFQVALFGRVEQKGGRALLRIHKQPFNHQSAELLQSENGSVEVLQALVTGIEQLTVFQGVDILQCGLPGNKTLKIAHE